MALVITKIRQNSTTNGPTISIKTSNRKSSKITKKNSQRRTQGSTKPFAIVIVSLLKRSKTRNYSYLRTKWPLLNETQISHPTKIRKSWSTISWKGNATPSAREVTVEAAKSQKEKKRKRRASKRSASTALQSKKRDKEDPQLKRLRESP